MNEACRRTRHRRFLWGLTFVTLSALAPAEAIHLATPSHPVEEFDVAVREDGTFAVAWIERDETTLPFRAYLGRYDAVGAPLGPVLSIWPADPTLRGIRLAYEPGGKLLVLFRTYYIFSPHHLGATLALSTFDEAGAVIRERETLTAVYGFGFSLEVAIAAAPSGGWMAFWAQRDPAQDPEQRLYSQPIAANGAPVGEPRLLFVSVPPGEIGWLGLGSTESTLLGLWAERDTAAGRFRRVVARGLDGDGQFDAPEILLAAAEGENGVALLAADGISSGDYFVTWVEGGASEEPLSNLGRVVRSRSEARPLRVVPAPVNASDRLGRALFAREEGYEASGEGRVRMVRRAETVHGAPLTNDLVVADLAQSFAQPALSVAPNGAWALVWAGKTEAGSPIAIGADIGRFGDGCEPDAESLCLSGGRFRVSANYLDHLGRTGTGRALPITADTGALWFFAATNLELFVKIVDACSHPDFENFWVFASGLTDVEVDLVVVDSRTGESWSRSTALGQSFPPVLDTAAFDTCGATGSLR